MPVSNITLSGQPVRSLSLEDLGLTLPDASSSTQIDDPQDQADDDALSIFDADTSAALESEFAPDEPLLILTRQLMSDGYAGVILTGPPGTGKSWCAEQLALALADNDPARLRFLQFHPSYQYEDFVEGYVPKDGGFERTRKHLLLLCETARAADGKLCVMVIDELSRSDPARVFGEALTYVETSKRGKRFLLASGEEVAIPSNLFFICTMNPQDRGVDEVDTAFERRFAKIEMNPDGAALAKMLTANGVPAEMLARIERFFREVQNNNNPEARVGHAYFRTVSDESSLQRLWDNQLRFFMRKAFRLDPQGLKRIEAAWQRVYPLPTSEDDGEGEPPAQDISGDADDTQS